MSAIVVHRVSVHRLSIPLRGLVEHAAAVRAVVEPIVVAVELRDGAIGYGETLSRIYVTGETTETALAVIESVFIPALLDFHPQSFGEALEAIEAIPWNDAQGTFVPAARAAVEMALLDAAMRSYRRDMDTVVQWMGLPGFGRPGSLSNIRFSGVIALSNPAAAMKRLRKMYWGGFRHFKIKVGMPGDLEIVRAAAAYLRRPIARGKASLRVDANGAWSVEQLAQWLANTAEIPLAGIEQPLGRSATDQLATVLAVPTPKSARCVQSTHPTWIHDESLISIEDAQRWIDLGIAGGFNIRLSKCGGMLPSLRIAGLARREGVRIQLGCMVGETSVLSAAGLRFLEACPEVAWAEGCFGSFLLSDDVVARELRIGFGGRPPRLREEFGLSPVVEVERLDRMSAGNVLRVVL